VDLAVSAELDDDGGFDRGAVWILNLEHTGNIVKSNEKISSTEGGFTNPLDNKDHFGRSICALGDIDGDGKGDLCVGAQQDDDGNKDAGAAYVLRLNGDGSVKASQKISMLEGNFTGPLNPTDNFGSSVAAPGDVNGDGIPDLAVGASLDDDGGTDTGAVYMLFLGSDTWTNAGFALAGLNGLPHLLGTGTLAPSSPGSLHLTSARPSSFSILFTSLNFLPRLSRAASSRRCPRCCSSASRPAPPATCCCPSPGRRASRRARTSTSSSRSRTPRPSRAWRSRTRRPA